MSRWQRLLRGSLLLSAAQVVGFSASFLRNILFARVLTKADFGIAAALSLTITALEISGKMAVGQQVVQSEHGDREDFLNSAHFYQFLSGLVGAVMMLALAAPLSDLFGVPQARWAFFCIALFGLVAGLQHLDVMRSMRTLSFHKRVVLDVVPEIVLTAAAVPLVYWLRDYRVIVILLFGKATISLVLSHVLAERRYRWNPDRAYLRQMWAFGWPLLLNSFLMFAYQQGDQVIIGSKLSVEGLAQYALAVSLTMVPGFMFQHVLNTIMLPLLSQAQNDPPNYRRRYVLGTELSTVMGVMVSCVLIIAGEELIVALFGSKYANTGNIAGWLAAANALRLIRSVSVLAAMARADTINNLLSNIFRASSLALAAWALQAGKPLAWVAACGVFGEMLALGVAWLRLSRKSNVPVAVSLRPTLVGAVLVGSAGLLAMLRPADASWPLIILVCLVVCALSAGLMWARFAEFRHYALRAWETAFHRPAAAAAT